MVTLTHSMLPYTFIASLVSDFSPMSFTVVKGASFGERKISFGFHGRRRNGMTSRSQKIKRPIRRRTKRKS